MPYNNQLVAMAEVANRRLASTDELFMSTFQVALITGQRDAVIVATYEQDPLMPVITFIRGIALSTLRRPLCLRL